MASFSDDFNRADDPTSLGVGWVAPLNTWGIASNRARAMTSAPDTGPAPAFRDVGSSDIIARVTIGENLGHFGLALRVNEGGDTYVFVYSTGIIRLFERTPLDYVQIGTQADMTIGAGDELRADAVGDQISVYVNDVLVLGPLTTSLQQTSPRHGISSAGMSSTFESFSIEDLNEEPPPPPPPPPAATTRLIPAIMKYIRDHVDEPIVIRKGPISPRSFPLVIVEKLSASTRPGSDTTLNTSEGEFYFQVTVAALDPEDRDRLGEKVEHALRPDHPTDPRPPILWDQGPKGREITRYPTDQRERTQTAEAPGGLTVYYHEVDMILLIQRGGID
jgi:hypothetical protein